MALATLPPAVEIVRAFESRRLGYRPSCPMQNLSEPFWAGLAPREQPPWKTTAFSKISILRTAGKSIPGLGNFNLSEQAVKALQKLIGEVEIESLPLPAVAPISGGAIFVCWQSGARRVEATAYQDGEILVEATENQRLDEERSRESLSATLRWLVQS